MTKHVLRLSGVLAWMLVVSPTLLWSGTAAAQSSGAVEATPSLTRAKAVALTARPPGWQSPETSSPADDEQLDWRQTVQLAVARYPSIAGARSAIDQQASLVDAARSGYLPRVQAEVTSGQQGEFGTGQVATVGLSQMLYDFGKTRSAVAREQAAGEREAAELLLAIDAVIEQTGQALIEIHRYEVLLDTFATQIEALGRVEEITRLRAEAGAATRSDPLQARARVEAVEAKRSAARAQIGQWRSRLQTYVGAEAAARSVSAGPGALLDHTQRDVDIDGLPALQVARAQRAEAEALLRNARAQRYPTISLEANANHRLGTAGERYEGVYGRRSYNNALISVRSDLYRGGAVGAQARASASALEVADEQLRTERLLALDALRTQQARIDGLEERIEVLDRRVTSIVETRELYWDQYLSLGTRNVLDLLNAEQEIGQSTEDLHNARHDLWLAQLEHLLASGAARAVFGLETAAERTWPGPSGAQL
ncbi:TolC family protein [Luteimonas fraxinea]|uniref:TolC family protein n=1 Tax=Luteimonas fraxinea TaxID=2901869 RepID=UPI001E3A04FE|nr:TolC family protein [Luteimonas fraxinea]MCD9124715.1 TolC family protein [Luteimonas fraxinea]